MEGESKYHVANILSSMAHNGHATVEVSNVRFCVIVSFLFDITG